MDLWRRLATTWRRLGVRGLVVKGMCVLEDHAFDLRYGTETHRKEETVDPTVTSAGADDAVRYAPTRARYFRALMRDLRLPRDRTFVDVGSGKGKVLMMALDGGFERVVGIEFSSKLCQIAQRNLDKYCAARGLSGQWAIQECDVTEYDIKDDESIFFLYHPFYEQVMSVFIANIVRSIKEQPRQVWLIYHKPVDTCRNIIEGGGHFRIAKKFDYLDEVFLIYTSEANAQSDVRRQRAPGSAEGASLADAR
jgi:SAM-dependent methyltransferase